MDRRWPEAEARWSWAGQLLRVVCPHARRTCFADGHQGRNRLDFHRVFLVPPGSPADGGTVADVAGRRSVPLQPGSVTVLPAGRSYRFSFAPGLRLVGFHARVEGAPGCDVLDGAVPFSQATGRLDECAEAWEAMSIDGPGRWLVTGAVLRLHLGRSLADGWEAVNRALATVAPWKPVLDRLAARPAGPIGVTGLARMAGISREAFTRRFTAAFDVSPRAWHGRQLAARAVARLLEDDAPLADLASDFGFADAFAFSRFVRRSTGASPSRIRAAGPFA